MFELSQHGRGEEWYEGPDSVERGEEDRRKLSYVYQRKVNRGLERGETNTSIDVGVW